MYTIYTTVGLTTFGKVLINKHVRFIGGTNKRSLSRQLKINCYM